MDDLQALKDKHIHQAMARILDDAGIQHKEQLVAEVVFAWVKAFDDAGPLGEYNDEDEVGTYDWMARIAVNVFLGVPQ